jgi:hypothetical protein
MDVAGAIASALESHHAVRGIRLVGSRTEGRAHTISDWDFVIETDDFESVEQALPTTVAPLDPIAAQWDPYSDHACYMLVLRGPTKVDLLFPDQPRAWSDAWIVTAQTLEAVDRHFWDWILWLTQKRAGGRDDVVAKSLADIYRLLLQPVGVTVEPRSIAEALDAYLAARSERERDLGVRVPRALERAVLPTVRAGPTPARTHAP